jgi:predicted permease
METLFQDIRFGLRMLIKNPGFTAIAALALALGIGANTAVFSVVNGVLLRPIPYKDSDRLVMLWNNSPGLNITQDRLSPAEYFDTRDAAAFEQAGLAFVNTLNLTGPDASGDDRPERIGGARVSSSLLTLLGAHPAQGRAFLPEEDQPGGQRTAIISDGLWHRRFGADAGLLGKSLMLDGQDYAIVGIMPPDFVLNNETLPAYHPVDKIDVLMPLPLPAAAPGDRDHEDYTVIARLKPNVKAVQAQAEVDTIVARLRQDYPQNYPANSGFTIRVVPMLEHAVGSIRLMLLFLLGAVAFVLLIACANVAGLLLSRSAVRRQEIAIRTAMGASRLRLIRQLLTESVLLSLIGGGLGLMAAAWGVKALRLLNAGNVPRAAEIEIDARVFAFTALVALLTGLAFGLVPALRASQTTVSEVLKEGGRDAVGAARAASARGLLVVVEIALSLILLVGAGLLIRSFLRLQTVAPGFSTRNILSFRLSLAGSKHGAVAARPQFYRELQTRIESLPSVESVGAVSELPLGGDLAWTPVWVDGYVPRPGETLVQSDVHTASLDYFRTMSIPLLSGRYFDERDTTDSAKVAVVDEGFADQFFPGQDPIGRRLRLGGQSSQPPPESAWRTIVGLVKSVKQYGLDARPRITCYFANSQFPRSNMYFVVRAAQTTGLLNAVAGEVRALDPGLPLYEVNTMDQRVAGSLGRRRFSMLMLGGFAALAMLLAVIGLYGVISYSVTQRTHELGIRMALGASPTDVLKLIVRQGMVLTLVGIALGLGGALALTRLMSSLLYGVTSTDPITFCLVTLLLTAVALAAQLIPARRAARVDPVNALRHE